MKENRALNESTIRELHKIILKEDYFVDAIDQFDQPVKKKITLGQYKTTPNHVKTKTGEIFFYTPPEQVASEMTDLMSWLKKNERLNPFLRAAIFHHRFVKIHPFDDGNGRMTRILMNLILMTNGYPPIVVEAQEREIYYDMLSKADDGDYSSLIEFLGNGLKKMMEIYIKAAKGENIDGEDNIFKKVTLFTQKVETHPDNLVLSEKVLIKFSNELVKPTAKKIEKFYNQVHKLFTNGEFKITINNHSTTLDRFNKLLKEEFKEVQSIDINLVMKLSGYTKGKPIKITIKILYHFETYHYSISTANYNSGSKKLYDKIDFKTLDEKIDNQIEGILQTLKTATDGLK